jgi:hypothetical protein
VVHQMMMGYTRRLTFGQAKSLKYLIYFLIKLDVKHGITRIIFDRVDMSTPGQPDTYRVRITYGQDS